MQLFRLVGPRARRCVLDTVNLKFSLRTEGRCGRDYPREPRELGWGHHVDRNTPALVLLLLGALFHGWCAFADSPLLKIERMGQGQARISWPVEPSGFALERTTSLGEDDWTIVGNTVVVADSHTATISCSEHASFYRLAKQTSAPRYRLGLQVSANGVARYDKVAEVPLNLTALLREIHAAVEVEPESLRVVELDAQDQVVHEAVPFQFDRAPHYHPLTNASGTLVFLLSGNTGEAATRRFHFYFGATNGLPSTSPTNRVSIEFDPPLMYQGQSSFRIHTPGASYYYHIAGAGFASMIDPDGNDWISFRPLGGSAGSYRGIPNLVYPEGHFHPGNNSCTSSVATVGPLKITVYSESRDKKWACAWDFFPTSARLTVLKTNGPYWFLYEGTPGGKLDAVTDFVVRSPGTRTTASTSWDQDLPDPEWVCFGDGQSPHLLFLLHHQDDGGKDSYWPMENNMTVFGFGRSGLNKYLNQVPDQFTIGFTKTNRLEFLSQDLEAMRRQLQIVCGPLEPAPIP